jgi:hypothetical protein
MDVLKKIEEEVNNNNVVILVVSKVQSRAVDNENDNDIVTG